MSLQTRPPPRTHTRTPHAHAQVMAAHWYDANVALPGCDKNMPGCLMAMARLNRPSLMVYGGTIRAGRSCRGEPLNIMSAFEAYGAYAKGTLSEQDRVDIVQHACPGPGACGGMYTANTSTPRRPSVRAPRRAAPPPLSHFPRAADCGRTATAGSRRRAWVGWAASCARSGRRDRGARHDATVQFVHSRRGPGQARRVVRNPATRAPLAAASRNGARPSLSAASHPHASVRAGAAIRVLLERNIRPSDILTRRAFENAMVAVMALGGASAYGRASAVRGVLTLDHERAFAPPPCVRTTARLASPRLDQRGAALDRHGQSIRRRGHTRRLPARERPRAVHCRPQTEVVPRCARSPPRA